MSGARAVFADPRSLKRSTPTFAVGQTIWQDQLNVGGGLPLSHLNCNKDSGEWIMAPVSRKK